MKDKLLGLPVIGTAIRMQDRYNDDAADSFAASIAFFGFVSLLPLILLAFSVMGFLVRGDAQLEGQILEAVRTAVPGMGQALGEDGLESIVASARDNAGSFLGLGTVTLLFSGMKVIAGAQRALAVVFRMEIPTGVGARLQQLLALVLLGVLALLGSAVGGSVGVDLGEGVRGVLFSVGLTLVAFLVDLALFLVAYRILSPDPGYPPWRTLLPGSALAAIAWVALKAGGAALVAGGGGATAGTSLASAVGLLVLLYFAGRIFMYGAELSALLGDIEGPQEAAAGDHGLVEPRPVEDVAPAPADLVKLAGAAAVFAVAVQALDTD